MVSARAAQVQNHQNNHIWRKPAQRDLREDSQSPLTQCFVPQLTNALRAFMGSALTVLDAGLALNHCSSPVKGLTPFLFFWAGFFFSFKLRKEPILKESLLFSCSPAKAM